jgi:hypothetical protein
MVPHLSCYYQASGSYVPRHATSRRALAKPLPSDVRSRHVHPSKQHCGYLLMIGNSAMVEATLPRAQAVPHRYGRRGRKLADTAPSTSPITRAPTITIVTHKAARISMVTSVPERIGVSHNVGPINRRTTTSVRPYQQLMAARILPNVGHHAGRTSTSSRSVTPRLAHGPCFERNTCYGIDAAHHANRDCRTRLKARRRGEGLEERGSDHQHHHDAQFPRTHRVHGRVEQAVRRGRAVGEGVIVGVIDSGIWPENPSLAAMPGPRCACDS